MNIYIQANSEKDPLVMNCTAHWSLKWETYHLGKEEKVLIWLFTKEKEREFRHEVQKRGMLLMSLPPIILHLFIRRRRRSSRDRNLIACLRYEL